MVLVLVVACRTETQVVVLPDAELPEVKVLDAGPQSPDSGPCTTDVLTVPMTCAECIARGGRPYKNQVGVCEIDNASTCDFDFVVTCTP